MQRISKGRRWIAALFAWGAISTANAIPIVDTGPGSYDPVPAIALFGDSPAGSQFLAGRFTTTEAYEITSLSAFVRGYGCCETTPAAFSLSLATGPDSPDDSNFSTLFSLPTSLADLNFSAGWADVAVDNYFLAAGTYWIVASVEPGQLSGTLAMPGGVANPLDAYAVYSSAHGSWDMLNPTVGEAGVSAALGFRVDGNLVQVPVPEPGMLLLMLSGLAGMLCVRRRRA